MSASHGSELKPFCLPAGQPKTGRVKRSPKHEPKEEVPRVPRKEIPPHFRVCGTRCSSGCPWLAVFLRTRHQVRHFAGKSKALFDHEARSNRSFSVSLVVRRAIVDLGGRWCIADFLVYPKMPKLPQGAPRIPIVQDSRMFGLPAARTLRVRPNVCMYPSSCATLLRPAARS